MNRRTFFGTLAAAAMGAMTRVYQPAVLAPEPAPEFQTATEFEGWYRDRARRRHPDDCDCRWCSYMFPDQDPKGEWTITREQADALIDYVRLQGEIMEERNNAFIRAIGLEPAKIHGAKFDWPQD